jgi:glycosyltransferase involved in cell wall biosynthesis
MNKKVTFVLNVRFPTEKAYGVTTSLTARAIQNTGDYEVEVVTPFLDPNHDSHIKVREVKMFFPQFYNSFIKSNAFFGPLVFQTWKMFYPLKLIQNLDRSDNVVWSRDIYTSLILSLFGYKTVCEIHRMPSLFDRAPLILLKLSKKATLAFISEELRKKCKASIIRSTILPMAVDESEIVKFKRKTLSDRIIIGYIGSSHSSGNKLLIEYILDAALVLNITQPKLIFRLIGITRNDFQNISFPNNIEFIERVPRSRSMEEIDDFDIGLVIYPDSKYYVDSFPIKIVEYAARGIPIIASNTRAHRNIIGYNKALYFDLNEKNNLAKSINYLLIDDMLRTSISNNLLEWVKEYTYQSRASKALSNVNLA